LRRVEARHERGIRSDIDAYTLRSQKHFQHAPVCRGLMYATLLSLIKDQKKKKELSLKPKLCYASSFYQGYRKKKSILKKCKKKGTFQDKYFMSDKNGDRSVWQLAVKDGWYDLEDQGTKTKSTNLLSLVFLGSIIQSFVIYR